MRKAILFLIWLVQASSSYVYSLDFRIIEGIKDQRVKTLMEGNAKTLLESINQAAEADKTTLSISPDVATPSAIKEINELWQCLHFTAVDRIDSVYCSQKNVEGQQRYEARHIIIKIIPLDDTYQGDRMREIRMDFDKNNGKIMSLAITMPWESVGKIKRTGTKLGVKDYERRQQIIDFCEELKEFYHKKDIKNLKKIYSKYAIIVTGKKLKTGRTVFSQSDGETYIKKLQYLFNNCKTIEVDFDNYEVMQDDFNPNYFVVTFEQDWHTIYNNNHSYDDFGYVCLLWDFSETPPVITFRSWQPKDTPESEKITIDNIGDRTILRRHY